MMNRYSIRSLCGLAWSYWQSTTATNSRWQNPSLRLPFCRENECTWRNSDRLILNDRHLRKTALDPRSDFLLFALRVNQF